MIVSVSPICLIESLINNSSPVIVPSPPAERVPVISKLPSILALPSTSSNSSESVKALSSAVIFTPFCVKTKFLPSG